MASEPGYPRLIRAVYSAELAGHQPEALLDDVTAGGLADADSLADVLRYRIHRALADGREPEQQAHAGDWTTLAAPLDGPAGQWAHELARAASERQAELGEAAAIDQPAWTAALGPVPDAVAEPAARAAWEARAGIVAGYRDLAGVPDEQISLGAPPSRERPLEHALYHHAAHTRGYQSDPEAGDVRVLSDAELYAVRERWTREQAWAPAYVADELAAAYQAAATARQDADLTAARLAQLPPDAEGREWVAAQHTISARDAEAAVGAGASARTGPSGPRRVGPGHRARRGRRPGRRARAGAPRAAAAARRRTRARTTRPVHPTRPGDPRRGRDPRAGGTAGPRVRGAGELARRTTPRWPRPNTHEPRPPPGSTATSRRATRRGSPRSTPTSGWTPRRGKRRCARTTWPGPWRPSAPSTAPGSTPTVNSTTTPSPTPAQPSSPSSARPPHRRRRPPAPRPTARSTPTAASATTPATPCAGNAPTTVPPPPRPGTAPGAAETPETHVGTGAAGGAPAVPAARPHRAARPHERHETRAGARTGTGGRSSSRCSTSRRHRPTRPRPRTPAALRSTDPPPTATTGSSRRPRPR